jgi:hypothetical protein
VRFALGPALLSLAYAAAAAAAQQPAAPGGRCELVVQPLPGREPPHWQSVQQPSGQYNTFIGGGARWSCPAQSIEIISDSIEYYGDARLMYLIGNVHYVEPRVKLDAERLTYWMPEERLRAEGNVDATLPSGTRMTGPQAEYFRQVPGIRTLSRMVAPGRPTIRLVEREAGRPAAATSEPTIVVANTVVMEGDSLVYASGRVEITRPDVFARSDSAAMDSGREWARLTRGPVVEGRGERPFVLTGGVIDLYARQRALQRVLSMAKAKAISDSLTITSDTLDFRMDSSRLERAFAWGKSRARAASPTYDIVADSLDVHMPRQRLREVRALRDAFAQSVPDTTRVRTTQHDWLRGDTIIAYFDTTVLAAPADSGRQPEVRELVAVGNARSFYQVAARDTTASGPAINYVRGRAITVYFTGRAVERVAIREQASGVYIEPTIPAARPAGPGAPPPAPPSGAAPPPAGRGGRS